MNWAPFKMILPITNGARGFCSRFFYTYNDDLLLSYNWQVTIWALISVLMRPWKTMTVLFELDLYWKNVMESVDLASACSSKAFHRFFFLIEFVLVSMAVPTARNVEQERHHSAGGAAKLVHHRPGGFHQRPHRRTHQDIVLTNKKSSSRYSLALWWDYWVSLSFIFTIFSELIRIDCHRCKFPWIL